MGARRPSFSVFKPPISLPGAWPSESTLSLGEIPVECPAPDDAVPPCQLVDIQSGVEGLLHRAVANAMGQRFSVATCDDSESVWSDDFYSFISQYDEDLDATAVAEPCNKKVSDANGVPNQCVREDSSSSSSEEASSSLDLSTCVDGSDTSPTTSNEPCKILPDPNLLSRTTPIFLKPPNEDDGRSRRTTVAISSPRQSVLSDTVSSSGSAHYGDEESNHNLDQSEDESAISFTRAYNPIGQLDYSNESEESISLHIPSTPPHRGRKSLQNHRPIARQESDLDITRLSQPDGDNPWTLSLEPALVNLSGFASASKTSMSVESSSVAHDEAPVTPTPPRVQSPVTTLPRPSFATARIESGSRIGLGRPSVDIPPVHHDYKVAMTQSSGHKRDVVKKPKGLYQKMKRFFTSKSSRQNESQRFSNDMKRDVVSPLPYSSPYFQESSSQWSFHQRAFQKAAKSSAPSIVRTEGAHRSLSYRSGVTEETRHTFDDPRSQPADDIRSSKRTRRFSVPTPLSFSSRKPVGPPSSARNASSLTNRSYQK